MHSNDEVLRYGVKRIDGLVTAAAATRSGDLVRAALVEIASDCRAARVRLGTLTAEGLFVAEIDGTVETVCCVEAIASAEQLPLLFDDLDDCDDSGIHVIPGLARALPRDAGFGSSSAPLLAGDKEQAA